MEDDEYILEGSEEEVLKERFRGLVEERRGGNSGSRWQRLEGGNEPSGYLPFLSSDG